MLTAYVGTPEADRVLKTTVRGTDPKEVGREAAEKLIAEGAKEIVNKVKREMGEQ